MVESPIETGCPAGMSNHLSNDADSLLVRRHGNGRGAAAAPEGEDLRPVLSGREPVVAELLLAREAFDHRAVEEAAEGGIPMERRALSQGAATIVYQTVAGSDELVPKAGGNRSGREGEQEVPYQVAELFRLSDPTIALGRGMASGVPQRPVDLRDPERRRPAGMHLCAAGQRAGPGYPACPGG